MNRELVLPDFSQVSRSLLSQNGWGRKLRSQMSRRAGPSNSPLFIASFLARFLGKELNKEAILSRLIAAMKKFLLVLATATVLPLLQSCVTSNGFGGGGGFSNRSFVSSVGIIGTSHPRWGYDPFCRSYYDFSLGQYYNLGAGSYFNTIPRRFNTPLYPNFYNRGSVLACPNNLPFLSTGFQQTNFNFVSTGNSRWAYDPYRRSYFDTQNRRYYNTSAGRYFDSLPQRHSSPRFPNGHRGGQQVPLNSRLPYVNHRTTPSVPVQRPSVAPQSYRGRGSINSQPSQQRGSFGSSNDGFSQSRGGSSNGRAMQQAQLQQLQQQPAQASQMRQIQQAQRSRQMPQQQAAPPQYQQAQQAQQARDAARRSSMGSRGSYSPPQQAAPSPRSSGRSGGGYDSSSGRGRRIY